MPNITIIDSNGERQVISVDDDALANDPDLKAAVDRITRAGNPLADYGNSYDRGGGHDKTFDKEPGHDRSHSKSD